MENIKYKVALLWINDEQVTYSIHSSEKIIVPRKEAWEYQPGEQVQARWGKRLHVAQVIAVDRLENKNKLDTLGLKALLTFQKKQTEMSSKQADLGQELEELQATDNQLTAARTADPGKEVEELYTTINQVTAARVDIEAKTLMANEVKSPEPAKKLQVIDVANSGATEDVRLSGWSHHGGVCGKCKEICRCKDISRLKDRVRDLEAFKKSMTEEMQKIKEDMVLMRANCGIIGSPRRPPSSDVAPPPAHPSSPHPSAAIISPPSPSPSPSPSHTSQDVATLLASVAHLDSTKLQQVVKVLAHNIFTVDELKSNSLSGKKSPHSKEVCRPPLNVAKVDLFKLCMQRHLPNIPWREVREKFQNVQKQERMKLKK